MNHAENAGSLSPIAPLSLALRGALHADACVAPGRRVVLRPGQVLAIPSGRQETVIRGVCGVAWLTRDGADVLLHPGDRLSLTGRGKLIAEPVGGGCATIEFVE
jgi:hypothetical protein